MSRVDQVKFTPPMAVAVGNVKFLMADIHHESKKPINAYVADVKVTWPGAKVLEFPQIVFLEHDNVATLVGLDRQGKVSGMSPAAANDYHNDLLSLIRSATAAEKAILGPLSAIFAGSDYSAAGRVIAAYIHARQQPQMLMGVSYLDARGKFTLAVVDPKSDGFTQLAELTRSYEAFGEIHH